MAADTAYEVLLFDLGGVLVELTGVPVMVGAVGDPMDEEIWRRWLTSPSVRCFETGRSTPQEFSAAMVEEFDLEIGPDEFLEAFRDWPSGFYPGTEKLLARLSSRFRLACLSNSNPLHWRRFHEELRLAELFQHHFASHLIGSLKPDREVFDHVVDELGCAPERVLFLDDNQMCVDGAREARLSAYRAQGLDGALKILRNLGVLSQEDARALGLG